jgi:hypothetical protein
MTHREFNVRTLKVLKVLLEVDDLEIIKCVIESLIDDIEEQNNLETHE